MNLIGDMKLEVIVIPVSDADRAKNFYVRLGWRLDADFTVDSDFRIIQVTPPGSSCSVIFGKGLTFAAAGSAQGLHLVVSDIEATRAELVAREIGVSEVFHDAGRVFHHAGNEGRVKGPDPDRRSYGSFASFEDPDGNGWILQEVTTRLPGRIERETSFSSARDLESALRRAASAHDQHEALTGKHDENWAEWYAEYLVEEQRGGPLHVQVNRAPRR
ncbi:Putative lyase [Labilithrix luteola]|uniref:Putative lyase n=1 Tax=Labilithrix luteola TaxID=1391654 RepID=A0A0K1PQ97_9BACT|nr:VOC family protein [Labilithrix luteola]AKU95705.1 Putative lyase [Labilithrix luteola]